MNNINTPSSNQIVIKENILYFIKTIKEYPIEIFNGYYYDLERIRNTYYYIKFNKYQITFYISDNDINEPIIKSFIDSNEQLEAFIIKYKNIATSNTELMNRYLDLINNVTTYALIPIRNSIAIIIVTIITLILIYKYIIK